MTTIVEILFWANVALAVTFLLELVFRPRAYCELPFLVSAMYVVWYLPQAWRVILDESTERSALSTLLLMSLLSLTAVKLGWNWAVRGITRPIEPIPVSSRRLLAPVAALTAFAWAMNALIFLRPVDEIVSRQWTGPITILVFLGTLSVVSLVFSIAMVLRDRSPTTIVLAGINLFIYLPKMFIGFRRADIFELTFGIMLGIWFIRRWTVPRSVLLFIAFFGVLVLNGAGQIRQTSNYRVGNEGTLVSQTTSINDFHKIQWGNVLSFSSQDIRNLEVKNGVEYIRAIDASQSNTFGGELLNDLVFSYVPAQFFGKDFKSSLMTGLSSAEVAEAELNYRGIPGITATGFVSPYRDFWYLGAFVFFLSSAFMGTLYRYANEGRLIGFALYASLLSSAVETITHSGYLLFTQSFLILAGVFFVLHSAAVLRPQRTR